MMFNRKGRKRWRRRKRVSLFATRKDRGAKVLVFRPRDPSPAAPAARALAA